MLILFSPPALQAANPVAELPLLPGSDPALLRAYQWSLAHSPSLQELVKQLARQERKARYRFIPTSAPVICRLVVRPTEDEYEVDILIPLLPWTRSDDALEPWIASALYLTFELVSKGNLRGTHDPHRSFFIKQTKYAALDFQAQVRKELVASDPERLKNLPDGKNIYARGFPPPRNQQTLARPRPLSSDPE